MTQPLTILHQARKANGPTPQFIIRGAAAAAARAEELFHAGEEEKARLIAETIILVTGERPGIPRPDFTPISDTEESGEESEEEEETAGEPEPNPLEGLPKGVAGVTAQALKTFPLQAEEILSIARQSIPAGVRIAQLQRFLK